MSAGAFLDRVKNAFSIGANNKWLFGSGQPYDDADEYEGEDSSYSGYYGGAGGYDGAGGYGASESYEQMNYQQAYNEQAYSQPNYSQPGYAQPSYNPQSFNQQAYSQQYYAGQNYPQQNYQQSAKHAAYSPNSQYAPEDAQENSFQFQSQFAPEGYSAKPSSRNHRLDQRRRSEENVVPFPEDAANAVANIQNMDAYVINVSNVAACRQAMICLRKGHCAIIVMDRLTDRSETRRYVDMLTGACYALNGTMTRLSSKIGFYLMAPSGMTVYTDAVTSNANNPRQMQVGGSFTQRGESMQAGFNASPKYSAPQTGFSDSNPYAADPMRQNAYQGRYEAPTAPSGMREAYYPQNEMAQ